MTSNLYVHPENQKLLWTTIQSVPFIANLPSDFKQNWFKNIIKTFYEQNPDIRDKASLQQINKQTIQYLVNSAKNIFETHQQHTPTQQQPINRNPVVPPSGIQSEFTRYDSDSKKNQEWYNKAFAERQKEYEIMHAKPLAPDVDFSIKLDDSPINNVNELVEKYKKDREADMNIYSANNVISSVPSSPSPSSSYIQPPTPISTVASISNMKSAIPRLSVIKEDDGNIELESEPISVSTAQEREIAEMKQEIKELKEEVEQLKKKLNAIIANSSG